MYVCIFVCLGVCRYTYVHICGGQQSPSGMVFQAPSTLLFEMESLTPSSGGPQIG